MRQLRSALPFTVAFGRPSHAELLILAGVLLILGAGAGWLCQTWQAAAPAPAPVTPTVSLSVGSTPDGAMVLVDNQPAGLTPATIQVTPGSHAVTFTDADAIPETRQVDVADDGAHLDVGRWRARPSVQYLKPTLPGAALANARFLHDGRVGLIIALPDGEQQAWLLDPAAHFSAQRLGTIASHTALTIRPDGQQVAALLPRESHARLFCGRPSQSAARGQCVVRADPGCRRCASRLVTANG